MQIAYHIGANCTDEERLLKSMLKNAGVLLDQGIAVPGPSKYRRLLRETIQGLDGAQPQPGTRDILLDAIVEHDSIDRLVMSHDNFIAIPKRIFDQAMFYPQAEAKVGGLARLFPQDTLSLFLGIRHPASFLQEVARRSEAQHLRDILGIMSPLDLRWADVVTRIRQAAPQAHIYCWCNEDTPLIWEDLIHLLTGISPEMPIAGQYDVLSLVVTKEGIATLEQQRLDRPPQTPIARHELIADIIDSYAKPDMMEEEIIYPELGAELVAAMTDSYEDDVDRLSKMDGVTLILPFT